MVYDQVGGPVIPFDYDDPIYDMCYELNQMADHYADGRSNGDDDYDPNNDVLNAIIPTLGVPTLSTEVCDYNCKNIFENLVPQAIRYTAGYMLHFLYLTGQISMLTIEGNVNIIDGLEQEYISQAKIRLFDSNTHRQIMESHLNASGQFMFTTLPGSYYIEYELSLPSLGYEYYPIRTDDFNLQTGNSPLFLPPVSFDRVQLNNVLVSTQSSYPCYESIGKAIQGIQAAVDSGYNNGAIVIKVLPGVYHESIDLSPLANGQIPSLTLKGWGEDVVIDPEGTDYCIRVSGNSISNITIENLTLTDAGGGVFVNLGNCERLTVRNCTISYCSSPNFRGLSISSNVPSTITDCTITNNIWIEDDQGEGSTAGLFLMNNTSSPTIVTGCTISNNYADNQSALYLSGSGHFDVKNNTFCCNNPNWDYQNPDPDRHIISFDLVGSANFMNNLILEEYCPSGISIHASGLGMNWINISNNTFNLLGSCISISDGSRVKVINSIFSESITGIVNEGQNNLVHITNDAFYSTTPFEGITYNPVSHPGCIFDEELDLDNNFVPIWNSTTMSICIDNGTGVNDSDKTPPDIGAFRATDHGYWQYRFRSGEMERSNPYHWVSYPVVNSLTQSKTDAQLFFHELLGTHHISAEDEVADVLDEIVWYENNSEKKIYWNGSGWGDYIDTHDVVSSQGYKVRLKPVDNTNTTPTTVELHHSGFLTPENTPFMIHGRASNGATYENWIGYFDTESVLPTDAFASIWNDITMIKAKDWCLYRDPNSGIGAIMGKMLPINCGDMVIVTTENDHEFQWDTTIPTDPKSKEVPTAFKYVEKADYTPVYVDLTAVDKSDLKEIGLKLDGICKGAVVVTDSLEQICVYLDEGESLSSGVVELMFFYESKSQPMVMRSVAINDKKLNSSNIGNDSAYPVYNIKVTSADLNNTVVPVLSLEQNYPNPFNPTTSIRYSIDEPGAVSLEIYNVKGQLVKTLYQGNADIGSHTLIWNGLNNYGNACSSGVYFYRLRTPKTTLVRKMLMLK